MKIVLPAFVLDLLETRACALLDTCSIVTITNEGRRDGDVSDAEVVMLPWGLSSEAIAEVLSPPTLRWVHTVSAGIDRALTALPTDRNIVITNAAGVFDVPIAEMVLAYILAVAKRLPEFLSQQRAHRWHLLRLREVADLTVGIVGLGGIGTEVACRCKALGMGVLATRRQPDLGGAFADEVWGPDRLPDLLRASDFVVIALPATPETRGLIGADELALMRADAWLINVARGVIVDQPALLETLQEGRIAGAALDVFVEEPLPEDSPLWGLPNVILTPHNSWSTPAMKTREAALFLDNLERYLNGSPLRNVVDPARGY